MNRLHRQIVDTIRQSPYSDSIGQIYLFGSHARGDATAESDVDLIVELIEPMGLEFIHLGQQLEDALGKKIDLLTTNSINHRLKPYIEKDKILLSE